MFTSGLYDQSVCRYRKVCVSTLKITDFMYLCLKQCLNNWPYFSCVCVCVCVCV